MFAEQMLGHKLITKQTGPQGKVCNAVCTTFPSLHKTLPTAAHSPPPPLSLVGLRLRAQVCSSRVLFCDSAGPQDGGPRLGSFITGRG